MAKNKYNLLIVITVLTLCIFVSPSKAYAGIIYSNLKFGTTYNYTNDDYGGGTDAIYNFGFTASPITSTGATYANFWYQGGTLSSSKLLVGRTPGGQECFDANFTPINNGNMNFYSVPATFSSSTCTFTTNQFTHTTNDANTYGSLGTDRSFAFYLTDAYESEPSINPTGTTTRVISWSPEKYATTTAGTTTISVVYYINSTDSIWHDLKYTQVPFLNTGYLGHYTQQCLDFKSGIDDTIQSTCSDYYEFDTIASSTATLFLPNNTSVVVAYYLFDPILGSRVYPNNGVSAFSTGSFITQNPNKRTGQTSADVARNCSPVGTSSATYFLNPYFSVLTCSYALFSPDPLKIIDILTSLKDGVYNSFPIGYLTSALTTLSTDRFLFACITSIKPRSYSFCSLDMALTTASLRMAASRSMRLNSSSSSVMLPSLSAWHQPLSKRYERNDRHPPS